MRKRRAGTHFSSDPNCFHKFMRRRAVAQGSLGVPLDAMGALSDVSDCDGNDLL